MPFSPEGVILTKNLIYSLGMFGRLDRQIPELDQISRICMVLFTDFGEREKIISLKIFVNFYEILFLGV